MKLLIEIHDEEYERWLAEGEIDAIIVRDALINAKLIKQEQEWIPVKSKLPKYNKTVLVSTGEKGYREQVYTAELRRRVHTSDLWWSTELHAFATDDIVNAWMPLPEPYKAESEET